MNEDEDVLNWILSNSGASEEIPAENVAWEDSWKEKAEEFGRKRRRRTSGPGNVDKETEELRKQVKALEEEVSFYRSLLKDSANDNSVEKLEDLLYKDKLRESKIRKEICKTWDEKETFGRDYQVKISRRFFHLAQSIVDVNTCGMYCTFMCSRDEKIQNGFRRTVRVSDNQLIEIQRKVAQMPTIGTLFSSIGSNAIMAHRRYNEAREHFAVFIRHLRTILRPSQLAKFIVWVYNDESCKEILDSLWLSTLEKLNIATRGSQLPAFSGNRLNTYEVSEGEGILRESRYECLCKLKSLLENPSLAKQRVGQLFRQDVLLVDLSTGRQMSGLQAIVSYCDTLPPAHSVVERVVRLDDTEHATCVWELAAAAKQYSLSAYITFGSNAFTISRISLAWTELGNESSHGAYMEQGEAETALPFDSPIDGLSGHEPPSTSTHQNQHHHSEPLSQAYQPVYDNTMYYTTQHMTSSSSNTFRRPQEEMLSTLRKRASEKVKDAFEVSDARLSRSILQDVVAPNAVFVDYGLGGEFHGLDQIELYIYRLRNAFPEQAWEGFQVEQVNDKELKCVFQVVGTYSGSLARQAQPCRFSGSVRLVFITDSPIVQQVYLYFDAHGLTSQFYANSNPSPSY